MFYPVVALKTAELAPRQPALAHIPRRATIFYTVDAEFSGMSCPDCGSETESRMAIIDSMDLEEEREYCLTCEKFVDEDAREPED